MQEKIGWSVSSRPPPTPEYAASVSIYNWMIEEELWDTLYVQQEEGRE